MSVVKVIELIAESDQSWEAAAQAAVTHAAKTIRNIKSLYVQDFLVAASGRVMVCVTGSTTTCAPLGNVSWGRCAQSRGW